VIACVASTAHPRNCLDGLADAARASYDAKLEAWATKWSEDLEQDEPLTGSLPELVDCTAVIGSDADVWPPALTVAADDRDQWVTLRRRAVEELCRGGWSEKVKHCLTAARDTKDVTACIADLEPAQRDELVARLAKVDAFGAKIAQARAKAPDCKKLVAGYYSDAAWKTKVPTITGAPRKKLIEASRKAMIEACTSDGWNASRRACLSLGGTVDCFGGIAFFAWGFPARYVPVATGVPECDAYIAAVQSYPSCGKLVFDLRDTIMKSIDDAIAETIELAGDPARRQEAKDSCKLHGDALRAELAQQGC